MLEVKSKQINGHTYQCTLFPAKAGYLKGMKIGKIFAFGLEGLNEYSIVAIIDAMIETDKDGSFILDMFSLTIRDGMSINETVFNQIFAGNYQEMVEALTFIIESNFSDFFDFLKKKADSLEEKKKPEEKLDETVIAESPSV